VRLSIVSFFVPLWFSIATKGLAQMTLGANKKEKQKILHDAINNITHCWNSSKIYFTYSRTYIEVVLHKDINNCQCNYTELVYFHVKVESSTNFYCTRD
jgi:hypothetical protein